VTLKPPRDVGGGIEPSWQRTPPGKGPDSAQLRAQGFRRGLVAAAIAVLVIAAGLAFAVLPRLVDEPVAAAPPPVKPAETPAAAPPQKDFAKLGALKKKFDDLRPEVAERLQSLEGRSAADWAGEPFVRGRNGLAAADALAADRDYEAALPRLEAASADLLAADRSAADMLRTALAAGREALERGTAEEAQRQFALALKIDPASAVAKRGLERAGTLDEVRRLLAAASVAEQSGDRAAAEQAWRAALGLDRDAQPAREGLARMQSAASAGAYAAAVAAGLDALSRRDATAARAAFDRAAAIRPGAPEVQEGLAQVERLLGDATIEQSLAAARSAERDERWSDALDAYRKALAIDPNLLAAQQGLERSEPRAMLDAELRAYIDKPERLFTTDVRAAARNALQRARSIAAPGPVLSGQVSTIDQLIGSAETPVALAISSDNVTEVTIYRVGKLGVFERRDMTLLPGRYTVVGTRAGFRDVRRELTILPGQASATVAIRCEEPI
jgi:tetratricopeptide (TPR) repeat protein